MFNGKNSYFRGGIGRTDHLLTKVCLRPFPPFIFAGEIKCKRYMDINSNFQIELLPNEEWRDVIGYEGLYQVSNMGRAYNVRKKCLCRYQVTPKGYIDISLSKNGKSKYQKLHRLIYTAFVGSIDAGKEIDHVNAIKHDNRLSNLRLVSHKENMNNPLTIKALSGKIGPLNPNYGRQASEETRENFGPFYLVIKIQGEVHPSARNIG